MSYVYSAGWYWCKYVYRGAIMMVIIISRTAHSSIESNTALLIIRWHLASLHSLNQSINQSINHRICYDAFYGNRKPAVMYLPCLFYPKNNAKATNLENWCKRNSHTFVCADYYGVARSSGKKGLNEGRREC